MTVLLGRCYTSRQEGDFKQRVSETPRFTYRRSMPPLPETNLRTDEHWGCCIRCAQGLLSQFVRRYCERIPDTFSAFGPAAAPLFYDLPGDRAPFGIHAFCEAIFALTRRAGEWVKASCMAQVIGRLLARFKIPVLIAENGFISGAALCAAVAGGRPALALIPLMLGPSTLGQDWVQFVRMSVSIAQAVGIIGGRQGRSFFVVGFQDEDFFFFDPHAVLDPVARAGDERRLFEPPLKRMKATDLNSSMLVGFFVTEPGDLQEIAELAKPMTHCPFALQEDAAKPVVVADAEWDIVALDRG
jgi:cysteine protease ATG4